MAKRKLFLHVGSHKTGTTTIQRGLLANKTVLEQQGYDFPDVVFNFDGHHNLVADLKGLDSYKSWLGGINELIEFAKTSDRHMILSSEEFDQIVTTPPLEKLQTALGHIFDIHIIGYLRPQEEFLQSMWQTEVKIGNLREDFHVWLPAAKKRFAFLEYDRWINAYETVFGREKLCFDVYNPRSEDLLFRFLNACHVPDISQYSNFERANISLSPLTFELARHLYIFPFIERKKKLGKDHPAMMLNLRRMAKVVEQFAQDEGIDLSLSAYLPGQLKELRQHYRPHNKKTAQDYFNRPGLFQTENRLRPSPMPMSQRLTNDQLLRLFGQLIEMEQGHRRKS